MTTPFQGDVAPGWGHVGDSFRSMLADGTDVGAGLCVFHHGEKVVDLTGGWRDIDRVVPYDDETLQVLFSTSKGIVSLTVAICVERGLLSYAEPVALFWPEFADLEKETITVAEVMSHQAGLYCLDAPATLEEALDWEAMTRRLAASSRQATKGHGYHALTWGWLAGELVRRVDGRDIGTFIAEELAAPVGGECWFGLPERFESRVAPLNSGWERRDTSTSGGGSPDSLLSRVLSVNGALAVKGGFNRRDVRAAAIPAANGISNARTVASMYSASFTETRTSIGSVKLLDDQTRQMATQRVTPQGERDDVLRLETSFAMGFMTPSAIVPFTGESSYGHPGAGGSLGFADPSRGIAFAYVMNRMGDMLIGDDRAVRLAAAVYEVVD